MATSLKKVGFVALVGRPNVGKSTLLNALINFDLAITSPVAQTTRLLIKGIYQDDEAQIVFVDTPGVHKPERALNEALNAKVIEALVDVDLACFLQPINEPLGLGDQFIINLLSTAKQKVAIITKLDLGDAALAAARASELKALGFSDVLGVSNNVKRSHQGVIDYVKAHLLAGPAYYEETAISDTPMARIASDIVRGAAINLLRQEVQHSLAVITTDYRATTRRNIYISAQIIVERSSQKAMVIGKNGALIKQIGWAARLQLEAITGRRVYLELTVRVNKNWTSDAKAVAALTNEH